MGCSPTTVAGACQTYLTAVNRSLTLLLIALMGSSGLGCAETAEPTRPIAVDLSSSSSSSQVIQDEVYGFALNCSFLLQATGASNARITFHSGLARVYWGGDRLNPSQEIILTVDDIIEIFGGSQLGPGEQRAGLWSTIAPLPMEIEMVLVFRSGDTVDRYANLPRRACIQPLPLTPPPLPTIHEFSDPAGHTTLPAGQTIELKWTVTSEAGLWTSRFWTLDPYDTSWVEPEHMAKSISRTISVYIPPGWKGPVTVYGNAEDAYGRMVQRPLVLP
jgi:hypothetical protein